MTIFIYTISFPPELTTKVYVGKTNNTDRRWNKHQYDARNGSKFAIHCALRKYGIENAIFEVISTCLKEEYANEAEIALIEQYDSFNNGYNMTAGGEGCGSGENHYMFGKHWSEETKKKHSIAKSGENNPSFGKFGEDNPKSNTWKLYFKDGRIEIINNLKQWSKQNGYNQGSISSVFTDRKKFHKDIIKVERLYPKINDGRLLVERSLGQR